jgi:hypothetical protein
MATLGHMHHGGPLRRLSRPRGGDAWCFRFYHFARAQPELDPLAAACSSHPSRRHRDFFCDLLALALCHEHDRNRTPYRVRGTGRLCAQVLRP